MIPFGPNLRTIIAINFAFVAAAIFAALAWLNWPDSNEDWRFGFFSILCGLCAFGMAVKGIGDIWQHVMRDLAMRSFHRQGRKPQSDSFADDGSLRKDGIIE